MLSLLRWGSVSSAPASFAQGDGVFAAPFEFVRDCASQESFTGRPEDRKERTLDRSFAADRSSASAPRFDFVRDCASQERFTGRQRDREARGRGFLSFSNCTPLGPSGNVKRSRARTSCGSRPREHFTFPSEGEISLPTCYLVPQTVRSPRSVPRPSGEEEGFTSSLNPGATATVCTSRRRACVDADNRDRSARGRCISPPESFVCTLGQQAGESSDNRRRSASGSCLSPSESCSRQGRLCRCGTTQHVAREAQIFGQNAPGVLHEATRVQVGTDERPLPLASLSPCLPVNLTLGKTPRTDAETTKHQDVLRAPTTLRQGLIVPRAHQTVDDASAPAMAAPGPARAKLLEPGAWSLEPGRAERAP